MAIFDQAALAAARCFSACAFRLFYQQGMEFIIQRHVRLCIGGKQLLVVIITSLRAWQDSQAVDYAPGIGVDDEHGPVEPVKQYCVGSFRADAVYIQQAVAQ